MPRTDPNPTAVPAPAELVERLQRAELETESLCAEILERYEEATLVYRVTQRLATLFGETSIARLVVEEARNALGVRVAELWVRGEDAVVLAAAEPRDGATAWELREQGPLSALTEGRPWRREAAAGSEAVIAVPLPAPGGASLGVIVMRGGTDRRSYGTGEIKLMTALASLASAFIRNGRLAEQTRRADNHEREEELSRTIRAGLFSDAVPQVAGLDIAGDSRPAGSTGTEGYVFFPTAAGSLLMAMVGVDGADVSAAMRLAILRGILAASAGHGGDPAEILERTASLSLTGGSAPGESAAVWCGHFRAADRLLDHAAADHLPPLWLRSDGTADRLDRHNAAVRLEPEDLLLVPSRGLLEAVDPDGERFGVERLTRCARACEGAPAASVLRRVFESVYAHCDGMSPLSDVALIVVRADGTDVVAREECPR